MEQPTTYRTEVHSFLLHEAEDGQKLTLCADWTDDEDGGTDEVADILIHEYSNNGALVRAYVKFIVESVNQHCPHEFVVESAPETAERQPLQPYLKEKWKLDNLSGEVRDEATNVRVGVLREMGTHVAAMMTAAPELVTLLDNVTAALETCLAHYGSDMPASDSFNRTALATEARALLARLAIK